MQGPTETKTESLFKEFFDMFKGEKTESTYTVDYPAGTGMYLTQAEVQQLQEVLRRVISTEEIWEYTCKSKAKYMKVASPDIARECYAEIARSRKKINSLAKIQAKLKHKLLTVG